MTLTREEMQKNFKHIYLVSYQLVHQLDMFSSCRQLKSLVFMLLKHTVVVLLLFLTDVHHLCFYFVLYVFT